MNLTLLSQQARHADHQAVEAAAFILALRARGVRNTAVLGAMERARRELFAPRRFADLARTDVALPLPCGQTMTAPSVVATMLVALGAETGGRALEIGTGSGWVTAALAKLGCRIHTIERYGTLAESAAARFSIAGVAGAITLNVGDGLAAGAIEGRFDRILVNGAMPSAPGWLTSLLAPGGRLVGALASEGWPRLVRIDRLADGSLQQDLGPALRLSRLAAGQAASL
jgi:protein-L-isoaspartate(D-aspartate) O-methyltransferase